MSSEGLDETAGTWDDPGMERIGIDALMEVEKMRSDGERDWCVVAIDGRDGVIAFVLGTWPSEADALLAAAEMDRADMERVQRGEVENADWIHRVAPFGGGERDSAGRSRRGAK